MLFNICDRIPQNFSVFAGRTAVPDPDHDPQVLLNILLCLRPGSHPAYHVVDITRVFFQFGRFHAHFLHETYHGKINIHHDVAQKKHGLYIFFSDRAEKTIAKHRYLAFCPGAQKAFDHLVGGLIDHGGIQT